MGLLDGTLKERTLRLEKMLSPSQYPKPSKESIEKLRKSIIQAKKKNTNNRKKLKRPT